MDSVESVLPQTGVLCVFQARQQTHIWHRESGQVACLGPGTWSLEFSSEGEGMLEQLLEGDEEGEIGWARQYIMVVAEVQQNQETLKVVIRGEERLAMCDVLRQCALKWLSVNVPSVELQLDLYQFVWGRLGCSLYVCLPRLVQFVFRDAGAKFTSLRLPRWRERLASIGMPHMHIRRSRQGWVQLRQAGGGTGEEEEPLEMEEAPSVSLVGLLMLLVMWAWSKNTGNVRELGGDLNGAEAVLVAMLSLLSGMEVFTLAVDGLGNCIRVGAGLQVLLAEGIGNELRHVWQLIVKQAGGAQVCPLRDVLRCLYVAGTQDRHTRALKDKCQQVLVSLLEALQAVLMLPLREQLRSDLEDVSVLPGSGRARRIPSAAKDAWLLKAKGKHKRSFMMGVHSIQAKRRRLVAPNVREHLLAERVLEEFSMSALSRYAKQLREVSAEPQSLSLSFDGVQVGGKERLTIAGWLHGAQRGFWLPPQDRVQQRVTVHSMSKREGCSVLLNLDRQSVF
eukprot:6456570-Amphidinium_carterae.2